MTFEEWYVKSEYVLSNSEKQRMREAWSAAMQNMYPKHEDCGGTLYPEEFRCDTCYEWKCA